jgi:DNA-nicking Smr family endonuclease
VSQVTEEDKLLFEQAIQGVKPMNPTKKVEIIPQKPKPVSKQQVRKKLADQIQPASYEQLDGVSAHETLLYYRKGLRMQDLAKLRRGEFSIQGRLDLHGYTEEIAQHRLTQFIHQGFLRKNRYLLVVHGKGYNSDIDFPVLKNLTNRLLRCLPEVLGFCSATQKDGGVGAVYVLLKGDKSERS